jgi:selenocysteine lyase/cysteine desulfurase
VVFTVREGMIRFAPHIYNTSEEMRKVLGVLEG